MPSTAARQLVDAALALRRSHPHAPALDVLDLALQPHRGASPDFAAGGHDLTDPGQPFGQLLREAFAGADWQADVLTAFFERYDFGSAA